MKQKILRAVVRNSYTHSIIQNGRQRQPLPRRVDWNIEVAQQFSSLGEDGWLYRRAHRMMSRSLAAVAERFGLTPKRLAADTAYGNTQTLKRLVERGIEPHIPVWDKSAHTGGLFSRDDFRYDEKRDVYICPAGKELKTSGTVHDGTTLKYQAKRKDCSICALKPNCTTGRERRIGRDVDQPIRDYVRSLADTPAFKRSRDERKKVEMAFAHMKRIFKLDRLRLRGFSGARDEILLTATAQNLRKLARYAGRAPPSPRSFVTAA